MRKWVQVNRAHEATSQNDMNGKVQKKSIKIKLYSKDYVGEVIEQSNIKET